ncbi:gamma-glutamyl-gamma-aminobutyrate hydrolase family protein [Marmoricola sp. RAF53]|uniref:gamma-glutamyl-gamma-aminobutyrate hydrolase family protein n=1 Tax=Marmoricola sp. RAF53 TaxID=3233059 RepID=UPI003F963949
MPPLIGLSAYREQARWGVWDTSADLLPSDYAWAVESAGGVPVLLPPSLPYAAAAAAVVARLDGLVVSGGADVQPERYDAEPHPRTVRWRADRDAWELALLDAAYARGLPVLGVCRGMQVMAVHAGGFLDQHVPDLVGHEQHNPGGDGYGDIAVRVEPGSRLDEVLGGTGVTVRCHHHQSVRTHPGFAAVAWAGDGLLEAIEAPGEPFRLAVQWHPEVTPGHGAGAGVFAALVEAAADR